MADFEQLRQQLRQGREHRDTAASAITTARESLKRIAAYETELDRRFVPNDRQQIAERARLRRERELAEEELQRRTDAHRAALGLEAGVLKQFVGLTDPRQGIAQFKDSTPILLMPVRLETRFKGTQLWVRVFPDDCWLDSFDPALTENEVANAKAYWAAMWQAGGIGDQERGAWRGLAASHGSGRASWIVQQFPPANVAAKPAKPRPEDVILTIATETPLTPAEEVATKTFWRDAWLADGDAARTASAQSAFEAAVGVNRAAEIAAGYAPGNFATPLTDKRKKTEVNVSVAFVIFPFIDTKQSAWSHAPKVTILPDRFVFIGYEGGNATNVVLGNPVPSPLIAGPDPSAPKDGQLQHDAKGNLVVPDELKWLTDFDRAVAIGMGFRIDLTEVQRQRGFERVLVVGLRLNADEKEAKAELETLLQHHSFSRTGLAVVPQGTPTNNTEATGSGFGRLDDPDESFNDRKQPLFTPESDWLGKRDGQWIAEYLGIDPALFTHAHHAGYADQLAARAMNIALWPATLGYWMETMMEPVFTRDGVEQTREFFNRYVVAGGAIPALRIGRQPYGILPATAHSRIAWLNPRAEVLVARQDPMLAYLSKLHPLLQGMAKDWGAMLAEVSFVGKGGDPHATLLDIVGLHPGSVEWSQRYAESVQTLHNRLNLLGLGGLIQTLITAVQRAASRGLLTALGYRGEKEPFILGKIYSGKHNVLKGGAVDDKPLSETEQVRAYTDAGKNYLQWLLDSANTSLDALYAQDGFKDDKPPAALLYLMLRHALQLGYHDVSVRLHENAGLFTAEAAIRARSDDPFLHIRNNQAVSESRYQPLYVVAPQITGSSTETVSQFIAPRIGSLTFARYLRDQLAAVEHLKSLPTAQLERAFADHMDCCSYRLDAWRLGIVNYQLALMRNLRDRSDAPARPGIYLGAYAWLEEVRPENKVLTPVELDDPDLRADFANADEPPLMRDSTNQGYVHAPSLNHAVAAAVLRNGFISNASPQNRQTMAVNLTSERVRTALAVIEGIRAGQGLADLLGYQFERGLHDRHKLAEVDKFIYKLRKAFPLRADRLKDTKSEPGDSIEAIEARNVIDGLALVEHMQKTGSKTYPFGRTDLLAAQTQAEADALNAEAAGLLDTHDAVADLALSEGVYQAVVGNYDRVASTYDAYARGNFPPEPDVVRTPLNGIGLTHRVALHLEAGADPNVSPIAGLPMTPRAQAEPALNRWVAAILPPLDQIACRVEFRDAAGGAVSTREITLRQLDLQPADLLVLIRDDNEQAMSGLDDRIVRFTVMNFAPRPDVPIRIRYMEKGAALFSVFEVMPLARNVRRLTTKSRPLRPTDLTLTNEAASAQDSEPFIAKARLDAVATAMQTLLTDLGAFQTQLEGPLSDLANRRGEILTEVDNYVADLTALLARAASFVVSQAGLGLAYDFRRRTFSAILGQVAERVTRWNDHLTEFSARLAEEAALPPTATDEERFALLLRAESVISTSTTNPPPATPAALRTHLETVKRVAFINKLQTLANVRDTTRTSVSPLMADVRALLPLTEFDPAEFSLTAHEDEMVRFTEDAARLVEVIRAELDRRLKAAQTLFTDHAAAATAAAKTRTLEGAAKVFLGDDFRVFPEFALGAEQGDEMENVLAASRSGELFQFLQSPPDPAVPPLDFPVDTWLYGVARVREKMHAWEQTVMFSGTFRPVEPELDALQLPFAPGDRWLGLEFPPGLKLDHDRLLYTAHFATPFNKAARQCGLLLDEWTEIIPASEVDTGIAFHHDRPNCEAPQSMLLVTPTEFRGAWRWEDLVDALNETLALAKSRAVEPAHTDATPYAPFLPATIVATQAQQLTIAADLALNNKFSTLAKQN